MGQAGFLHVMWAVPGPGKAKHYSNNPCITERVREENCPVTKIKGKKVNELCLAAEFFGRN